jgi:hypothetical protein
MVRRVLALNVACASAGLGLIVASFGWNRWCIEYGYGLSMALGIDFFSTSIPPIIIIIITFRLFLFFWPETPNFWLAWIRL